MSDADAQSREDAHHDYDDDADSAIVPRRRFRTRRRDSDSPSSRPFVSRHRGGPVGSDRSSSSASEEEIEVLPDRFDSQGRPLGAGPSRRSDGWTERRGDFEYRSPRLGGTQMRGTFGVAGTDPEHVERMMRDVSGVLAGEMPRGMGGWLGLAGRLLGGVIAPGAVGADEEEDDGEDGYRRGGGSSSRSGRGAREERGVIGYGGGSSEVSRDERGKGRRMVDDHGYNDEDDEEQREGARSRRRRKRREVD